jgi:phosphoenolpyruvate phosphomutase
MSLKYRILPEKRREHLKALINSKANIRLIEAHSGLSAIVGSMTKVKSKDNITTEFDGLWISSMTSTASNGLPDVELSSIFNSLNVLREILNVTEKPLIVDGNTGGDNSSFEYLCSRLESMGVSAIIIEDKQYPKRNSLSKETMHFMEDPEVFANKIKCGRNVLLSDSFMIFARVESFIANLGIEDALQRARVYLLAGADGIVIHSNNKSFHEISLFISQYKILCEQIDISKPLICIPTTYNSITDNELFGKGVSIVIHANHLLRASHKAMMNVCESILFNDRSLEPDELCSSVSDIFEVVGFNDIVQKDINK